MYEFSIKLGALRLPGTLSYSCVCLYDANKRIKCSFNPSRLSREPIGQYFPKPVAILSPLVQKPKYLTGLELELSQVSYRFKSQLPWCLKYEYVSNKFDVYES